MVISWETYGFWLGTRWFEIGNAVVLVGLFLQIGRYFLIVKIGHCKKRCKNLCFPLQ